jgi:hypothetical protein
MKTSPGSLDSLDRRQREMKSMKPRSTALCAWMLAAFCLSHGEALAQEKEFYFGGMVGATESRLTDLDGYRYTFSMNVPPFPRSNVTLAGGDSEFNPGLTVGGWVFWNASHHVGLQFGVTYSQQGGRLQQTGSQMVVDIAIRDSTLVQYDLEHTFESAYVRLPVLAKIQYPTKSVTPYLKIGPEIGFLTGAERTTKGTYSTPQLTGSRLYVIDEKKDIEDSFQNVGIALDVAVGAEVPIGRLAVLVEFGYLLGLNDASANTAQNFTNDVKNSVMSLTAGIQF